MLSKYPKWQPVTVPVDVNRRGGGTLRSGQVGGSGGGPGNTVPAQLVALPPWFIPPFGSQNFFIYDQNSPGAGPVTKLFNGKQAAFQLAANMVGVIREVLFDVNGLLTTSAIAFQVLLDGAPVSGFDNYQIFPRSATSVAESPDNVFIKVGDGQKIECRVIITDTGTYQVGFSMRGWQYSKGIADQWRGIVG